MVDIPTNNDIYDILYIYYMRSPIFLKMSLDILEIKYQVLWVFAIKYNTLFDFTYTIHLLIYKYIYKNIDIYTCIFHYYFFS